MTLLDDSFKAIANAVMWGRSLYHNLQRFLFFQLVVNAVSYTHLDVYKRQSMVGCEEGEIISLAHGLVEISEEICQCLI